MLLLFNVDVPSMEIGNYSMHTFLHLGNWELSSYVHVLICHLRPFCPLHEHSSIFFSMPLPTPPTPSNSLDTNDLSSQTSRTAFTQPSFSQLFVICAHLPQTTFPPAVTNPNSETLTSMIVPFVSTPSWVYRGFCGFFLTLMIGSWTVTPSSGCVTLHFSGRVLVLLNRYGDGLEVGNVLYLRPMGR
jgi:hypothetical protein